ncbi:MAG: methionyl-tRNA formyltransferase, partial [Kaistella sp.]
KGRFELSSHGKTPGSLEIDKNSFKIFATNGIYFPEELQLEGKKRMNVKDFLNGFRQFDTISR